MHTFIEIAAIRDIHSSNAGTRRSKYLKMSALTSMYCRYEWKEGVVNALEVSSL